MAPNPIIWQPDPERAETSAMHRFIRATGHENYASLYRWSVEEAPAFWEALCAYCDVRFDTEPAEILARPDSIIDAGWFSGSRLSFPAHLLRHAGNRPAIIFCGENGVRRELGFDELRSQVAAVAEGLKRAGVAKGDRVAGFLPNCPEAVIAMLATTSIGAIWSSCSPDFGINGVVDRFGQIEPKILFAVDGYYYNGKTCDTRSVVAGVVEEVASIERTVIVPFVQDLEPEAQAGNAVPWDAFAVEGAALAFESVEFDHPLYIMYSSGTTGAPKCIVHGHGGTLLQHLKELQDAKIDEGRAMQQELAALQEAASGLEMEVALLESDLGDTGGDPSSTADMERQRQHH